MSPNVWLCCIACIATLFRTQPRVVEAILIASAGIHARRAHGQRPPEGHRRAVQREAMGTTHYAARRSYAVGMATRTLWEGERNADGRQVKSPTGRRDRHP